MLYMNPFIAWTQLAWKSGELMLHSGEVIGRRMGGMALNGLGDGREIALMSREKLEAATQSGYAMWWALARMNQQLATLAMQRMLAGAASAASIAASRNAAESVQRQVKALGDAAAHSATSAARITEATARVAQRGLTPVRARAARNAKRLRKRRR